MNIKFERATIEDADVLINVRNLSFYSDYIRYGECPGYNKSKDSMIEAISTNVMYKIILDDKVVGNISVRDNHDTTYYLGSLCVIPEYENKGIGQKAIQFIEEKFTDATLWTLETPADKERNHYFYKKAGYEIVDHYKNGSVELVLFQKNISPEKGR